MQNFGYDRGYQIMVWIDKIKVHVFSLRSLAYISWNKRASGNWVANNWKPKEYIMLKCNDWQIKNILKMYLQYGGKDYKFSRNPLICVDFHFFYNRLSIMNTENNDVLSDVMALVKVN